MLCKQLLKKSHTLAFNAFIVYTPFKAVAKSLINIMTYPTMLKAKSYLQNMQVSV